ncbi:MAG: hypothetical protein HOW97_10040 [Catenulispora sp.]|nr:hypothetical protein [Catenulispora sp.]
MTYRLTLNEDATKTVAAMDARTHELFVLAALDLPRDPHLLGRVMQNTGAFTTRAHILGSMGFIVYDVDDISQTITVTRIIWTG